MSAPGSEQKRSEVDPTRIITDEYWAVSLVRLPDSSHDQHAFLVMEGKSGNRSMIWFADFVAKNTLDSVLSGLRDGKVRMDKFESVESESGLSSKLLFNCRRQLMEIQNGDSLLYSTYPIPKLTAQILIKNIEKRKDDPPKYNMLGNSALAASSATASSKPTGHNCFTFARMMLRELDDEYIKVPGDSLDKWIYSASSRVLVDKKFNAKWWKASRLPLMFTYIAGVVTAYVFLKVL